MQRCLRLLLLVGSIGAPAGAFAQEHTPPTLVGSHRWTTATVETLIQDAERGRVHVELDAGRVVLARRSRQEHTRSGSLSWFGTLDGPDGGTLALAFHGDAVAGTLRRKERLVRIRASADGGLISEQHDLRSFAPCGNGPEHHVVPAGGSGVPQRDDYVSTGSQDTVVDVLVVWTGQAQAVVGGPAAMQALVDLAVLETNVAYDNSGVEIDLRLVHATHLDYVEAPAMQTDLARLRDKNDGFMDVVHPMRDAFGADGVSLIVSNTNPCGVGYLMQVMPSATFERSAFNAVSYSCATGNFSFGHEFGHNFGLDHDRVNASGGIPSQPYAYGHRTTNNAWRTIMAIFQGSRIQYFSTPDRTFAGFPLGIAAPSPDAADNTRALNVNADTIAAWRPTAVPDQDAGVQVRPVPGRSTCFVIDDTGGRLGPGATPLLVFSDGSFVQGAPWDAGQRSAVLDVPAASTSGFRPVPDGLLVLRDGRIVPPR